MAGVPSTSPAPASRTGWHCWLVQQCSEAAQLGHGSTAGQASSATHRLAVGQVLEDISHGAWGTAGHGLRITFINPSSPSRSRRNHAAPSDNGATALTSGSTSIVPRAIISKAAGY